MKLSWNMQSGLFVCCVFVLTSSILFALSIILVAMPGVVVRALVFGAACSAAFLAHRGTSLWIAAGAGLVASLLVALLAIVTFPQVADGLGNALSGAVLAVVLSLALVTYSRRPT